MIPEIEKKPLNEIKEFQEAKLRSLIVYLENNSKYYSNHPRHNNINISYTNKLEDLRKIPVTIKDDLQKYSDIFLCAGKNKIIESPDENDEAVSEGSAGEVTITTSGVEGMPLLRFKTGDICNRRIGKCSCGRTTMRLGAVTGRKKQMLKLKGTTLFPPAINDVLNQLEFIDNYIVDIRTNESGTDEVLIKAGIGTIEKYTEGTTKDHFRSRMRVAPEIELLPPKEITALRFARGSRKPWVFLDHRNIKKL